MSLASNLPAGRAIDDHASARRIGIAILFLTVLLNLFDRQVINVLAVGIKADL